MSLKIAPHIVLSIGLVGMLGIGAVALADGWDPTSKASNIGSISNTRHNLTIEYSPNFRPIMGAFRNDYGEVCVYCHTPHGANTQINAPLWNRTVTDTGSYSIYDRPTTLGLEGRMNLPGPSSLTCLSCHDGTIAIDSVLNMPGSGLAAGNSNLSNVQVGTSDDAFLDTWATVPGNLGPTGTHAVLGEELGRSDNGCSLCHRAALQGAIPDYSAFMLGTDLRNDHVIGITYPTSFNAGIDYNEPNMKVPGKWAVFDSNGNGFAEKYEVRLYDSGNGAAVECASCHDPHGIPSDNGAISEFIPSFLRISNSTPNGNNIGGPSGLCLTCHTK